MEVQDGFVDEETDKVYQTSKSELKRHATMDPLWAANRISVLEAERASWGNEFSAVYMAKGRIAKLEALLREARDVLDACGFDGDPDKRLKLVDEAIQRIDAALRI